MNYSTLSSSNDKFRSENHLPILQKKDSYRKNITSRESDKRIGTASSTRSRNEPFKLPKLNSYSHMNIDELLEEPPQNLMFTSFQAPSSSHKKGSKPGNVVIKLPIFRMPVPDASMHLLSKKPQAVQHVENSFSQLQFITYRDIRNLRKALMIMMQQLTPFEKEQIINYCHLSPFDIEDALYHVKEKVNDLSATISVSTNTVNNSSANSANTTNTENIMNNFFLVDENLSLFISAKYKLIYDLTGENRSFDASTITNGTNKKDAKADALRAVSRGMDFRTIGITNEFKDFLLSNTVDQRSVLSFDSRSNTSLKRSHSPFSHSLPNLIPPRDNLEQSSSYKGKKLHRPLQSSTINNIMSSSDPKELTSALLSSIMSVQKHSSLMKKSLEKAKKSLLPTIRNDQFNEMRTGNDSEFTTPFRTPRSGNTPFTGNTPRSVSPKDSSPGTPKSMNSKSLTPSTLNSRSNSKKLSFVHKKKNPRKAREVILMLGAEKLGKALQSLLFLDLRKGFKAWYTFIEQERKSGRIYKLCRMLVIRNIVVKFHNIVLRILVHYYDHWKAFAQNETQRLKQLRILNATIMIQSAIRRAIVYRRTKNIRHRQKYEKLYDATIKIQALMRGTRIKWQYRKLVYERKLLEGTILVQRVWRGYSARKRVYNIRKKKIQLASAIIIQRYGRGYIVRKQMSQMKQRHRLIKSVVKMQSIVRGFMVRKNIQSILVNRAKYDYAVKIQSIARGVIARKNIHKKIREIEAHKLRRFRAARSIQAAYRGYRARIYYQILLYQFRKERNQQNIAMTTITRIVRGFVARRQLIAMKQERMEHWVTQAKLWSEIWSEDYQTWIYYNAVTGETLYEPHSDGYIKSDGRLVLTNGSIIEDPANAEAEEDAGQAEPSEGMDIINNILAGGTNSSKPKTQAKVKKSKLCTECEHRVAIRHCNECGDNFCTKCYKHLHLLGARRHHTFTALGPRDCDECENILAIRYCVSCDECFCESCWKQLHSHGKRIFHPYSDISPEGRIDARVFTMDGEQIQHGYDTTYSQQQSELSKTNEEALAIYNNPSLAVSSAQYDQSGEEAGGEYEGYQQEASLEDYQTGNEMVPTDPNDPWTQYYDDDGNIYYYNNFTGESQYENPYY